MVKTSQKIAAFLLRDGPGRFTALASLPVHGNNKVNKMMPASQIDQIVPELRDAVGPVIVISGVGLLLLTMTNRLGRAIDRARQLKNELAVRTGRERDQTLAQVKVLYRRARIIRLSIILAASSAALAALMIVALFVDGLLQARAQFFIALLFIGCMGSLFASLVTFIRDINLSLQALKLELEDVTGDVQQTGSPPSPKP